MKEILKRYAKLAVGRPFSPGLLNILVTSVCDMRCHHCFFTDELDDAPRKKLQMKTAEIEKISETLGGNLGVLILAGGEPFTRKDLPEIARAFTPTTNWNPSTSPPTARFRSACCPTWCACCRNAPHSTSPSRWALTG